MTTKISIAIVLNDKKKVLISLRNKGLHQEDKWEFPGGKVDLGESFEQAMCRELKEEVELTALNYKLFKRFDYDYEDKKLSLCFYLISDFEGIASTQIGQKIKWVTVGELLTMAFPAANKEVIEMLAKQI